MARPILNYDAISGSDTAASGAGPATAITGTGAAHTNGAASTTITLTNSPDLSGVAVDHVLWMDTASGRKFSKITAVDDGADTVTVEDSFNIGSGSAVDYAIGGERKTFEGDTGQRDWLDWKGGWIIELNDGGVFLVTAEFAPIYGTKTTGTTEIRTVAGWSTKASIKCNTNFIYCFINSNATAGSSLLLKDVELNNQGAADGDLMEFGGYNNEWTSFQNVTLKSVGALCYITGELNAGFYDVTWETTGTDANRGYAFNFAGGPRVGLLVIIRNRFIDIAREVFRGATNEVFGRLVFEENIFDSCGGTTYDTLVLPVDLTGEMRYVVRKNAFYNCGGSAVRLLGTISDQLYLDLSDNKFESSGAYGIEADDPDFALQAHSFVKNNSFYANTSGETSNVDDIDSITLTASSFTDPANGDFSNNDTAGGGLLVDNEALEIAN